MFRRFRICMAKGGRGSLRPSYGWPNLTILSRFVAMQIRWKINSFLIFGPIALKRIEHGVLVLEPMVYSFQSNRTKNKKVLIFHYTEFASPKISKRGLTSAGRNSALKTPYPPLPNIFWTLWTWGFTRYHLMYSIPIEKIEQIAIELSVFWAFFGDFWGREPDLHSEFSDFQNLSVFSNFLAWNHIVCHRYR